MKAHIAKLSLALLSTVFLLGCQEQGSGPVGPEGPQFDGKGTGSCGQPHCHGDDVADPEQSTLTLADGMQQAVPFPVGSKDTRKTLKVSNHSFEKPTIAMNFGGLDACVGFASTNGGTIPVGAEFDKLVNQLTEPADAAKLVMSIDKNNLGSESDRHALTIQYDEVDLGQTYIMLGGWPGPVNVTGNTQDNVFTFTGPVVVWDPGDGIKAERLISCPGQTVTVTLIP